LSEATGADTEVVLEILCKVRWILVTQFEGHVLKWCPVTNQLDRPVQPQTPQPLG